MISDLSLDLIEEILSRAPITSLGAVRSTCKRWNALSKDQVLCKAEAKHQFLGFMMKNSKFCSLRFDLHGHEEELADPSVKEISSPFNQVNIYNFVLCDGLLLCIPMDQQEPLMVWNPYLGQTRLIQRRYVDDSLDTYALGYDNSKNRNPKLLRYFGQRECEIYDFESDSWRVLDDTLGRYGISQCSAYLKGNAYFLDFDADEDYFHCFDFTTERFGQFLDLPWSPSRFGFVRAIFSLREEKLAALSMDTQAFGVDIWVTTKIEPNAVSWSNFLRIDVEAIPRDVRYNTTGFFIDEEKKLAVVFCLDNCDRIIFNRKTFYNTAYIIGENEFLKAVDLGESNTFGPPVVCTSSYVPSLAQIKQNCTMQKEREEEEASEQALVLPFVQKKNTKWSLEDYLNMCPFYNNMLLISCITSFSMLLAVLVAMYFQQG